MAVKKKDYAIKLKELGKGHIATKRVNDEIEEIYKSMQDLQIEIDEN